MASDASGDGRSLPLAMVHEGEKLLACVPCGLCLPACPTYGVLRDELYSPRGRLHLMRAAAEGRMEAGDVLERHLARCLGCRACETACPSGVRYGSLLEAARADLAARRGGGLERAILSMFESPRRLDLGLGVVRALREAGLTALAAGRPFPVPLSGEGARVPGNAPRPGGVPAIGGASSIGGVPATGNASRTGGASARRPSALRFAAALLEATRGRLEPSSEPVPEDPHGPPAILLDGCVMPRLFAPVHQAAGNLLRRAGLRLVPARKAGCCGALHAHAGLMDDARRMARRNIDAFEGARFIVTESAGCGAMMREYGELLAEDPRYAERAREFSMKVRDLSEMLVEAAFKPGPAPFAARIAYDAPCHLHHAQKVTAAPLQLLAAVPGATLVPLAFSDRCCGGAGLYNVQQRALSWDVLAEKLDAVRACGAEIVATGNPGCLMQIGAGLRLAGLPARAHHPAEILEASWAPEALGARRRRRGSGR